MAARRLELTVDKLTPDHPTQWVKRMSHAVPAGLGRWHRKPTIEAARWLEEHPAPPTLPNRRRALEQLGTLGSGNHFIELAADEDGGVWILLHSGSRGAGNTLASMHTRIAKKVCTYPLPDPELAWLEQGTPEFEAYLRDLGWSQRYAARNRELMLSASHQTFETVLERDVRSTIEVNCHHNYTQLETHDGRQLWITRKGAIRAGVDDWGLIPGAMGQRSFVVKGRGNPESYESSAHGAGRAMSRSKARKTLSVEAFAAAMGDAAWQHEFAEQLLDEHPSAYKPIDVVMRDEADLVEVVHELRGLANYKGTS
jgi:tRNA-splicing ligase RtcB